MFVNQLFSCFINTCCPLKTDDNIKKRKMLLTDIGGKLFMEIINKISLQLKGRDLSIKHRIRNTIFLKNF